MSDNNKSFHDKLKESINNVDSCYMDFIVSLTDDQKVLYDKYLNSIVTYKGFASVFETLYNIK